MTILQQNPALIVILLYYLVLVLVEGVGDWAHAGGGAGGAVNRLHTTTATALITPVNQPGQRRCGGGGGAIRTFFVSFK